MPLMKTNLDNTRERAGQIRFEPGSGLVSTNVQTAIEEVATQVPSVVPTPVTSADSPYVPLNTDTVLYVDTTGGAVIINLPAALNRLGKSLRIKDSGGAASSNNITINPSGAETIETLANYVITVDYGGADLDPVSGTGWFFG